MPDYNPAVAAGLQPPQDNFSQTLGTIANLQERNALTGYYQMQAAQQMRRFNALQAAAGAYRSGQPMLPAFIANGGDPQESNAIQTLDANTSFMRNNHGMLPQGLEATASASANFARAANERAQLGGNLADTDTKIRNGAASVANMYIANPGPQTRQDMIDYATKYKGKAAGDQLAGMSDDQLMARATGHVGGGLTADQGAATVQTQNAQGAPVYQTRTQFLSGQGGGAVGQSPAAKEAATTQAAVPAELDKDLQAKAQGAVEAVQRLTRLQNAVNTANPANFGSMLGSDYARQAQPIPSLAAEHDNLKSLYTDAGSAMLKARFGSRVTNMDVSQGMKIVGGTTVQNKATALKIIGNNMSEAYDTIANGLKRGVINANDVLAKPTSRAEADALGPGALWIAPDGSIRRNAK